MVGDMVFKLPARSERYRIYHNMIVNIIRVQVGGNDYLIILAPHPPCRFQSNLMRFFGSNLAADKTLITVIGNIPAELSVPPFSCHHTLVIGIFIVSFPEGQRPLFFNGNRQTSGRKKRPPPQRPGFEMAVRDSIRF